MAESESHAGDADAMLDDLGPSRRPSKGGKHFVKKGRTIPLPTPVDPAGATLGDEPVAGPSTAPATYSEPPASSQHVAQLQATVDALAGQMAWFVEKLRGEVEDPPTDAELTDTEELPLAAGVRDETVQVQSVTAGAGVDTQTQSSVSGLDSIEQFYMAQWSRQGRTSTLNSPRLSATWRKCAYPTISCVTSSRRFSRPTTAQP